MAKESVIIRIIKGSCLSVGLHVENTYRKTDMLLKLYRKVNWSIGNKIEDLKMVAYDNCMGDTEFFSYLLNFAPEKELEIFRIRAVNVIQTKLLIDLIDRAVQRIREYPDDGKTYHSILDLKYMNFFKYTEDEILEELALERSTYYRKKKEAIWLLGYLLFGHIMPEYIKNEKVANACN